MRRGNELKGKVALALLVGLAWPVIATGQPIAPEGGWEETGFLQQQLDPVFHDLPDNVEILRLENGLQVILMRNPAQPMVGMYVQVEVGSAYEDFRTSGMSHMLEHLLFNGTEQFTQEELYDLADRHGAYNNANTTDFYTNYMLVLPAGEIETGLKIQSQMLFHSVLPPDKFAKEKGIVLGEIVQSRDTPGHFADSTLRDVLYAGTSLALPTLGTRSTIENMERDDVFAFYRRHYVPNNMTLTVAGNFDRDRTLELLEKYYGSVPPGDSRRPDLRLAYLLDRTRTVVRRGGAERVLALAFDAPGYGSPDFFPFLVLANLLDAEATGILTRAIEDLEAEERPELSVWWEKAEGFARLVLKFTLPATADPERFYRLVQEACTAALEFGFTDEDVLEVVHMEETETLLQREQLRMTGIFTAEPIALGGVDFFISYLGSLSEVEAEEVARVLGAYLIEAPCLAVLIEPDAAAAEAGGPPAPAGLKLPPGMKVPPAMLEAMRKAGMSVAPDDEEDAGGESAAGPGDEPTAGGEPLPVERTVLQNGAVLVTQQNPVSPLMAIHLTVRNRAVVDEGRPGVLNLVHRLLDKGVGGCDETCLSRKLRRLGAVVKLVDNPHIPMDDYYTNGRFSFVRVEVAAENGLEVLELLADMSQHASFSALDFERECQEQVRLLEKNRGSARSQANELLREALYGGHPLVRPAEGSPESMAEATYDETRTIYRRAFAPENLIFSIVSPFAHQQLTDRLEDLLPGRGRPTAPLPPLPRTETEDRVTASLGGEMAAIRLGALLRVAPEDEKALEILTAILSDRLARELRESRGLSYSVGASVATYNGEGSFTAWINPPRERLDEGELALAKMVADFDPLTIGQDELDRIRSARRGRWMMRKLSSISQAYYLAMAELDGDVTRFMRMLSGYDELTLADLQRVGAEYLAGLPLVTVVVD